MSIFQSVIGVGLDILLLLYIMKYYKCKYNKIVVACYCLIYMTAVIILNNLMGASIFRLPIYCFFVWLFIVSFYEETTRLLSIKLAVTYFVIMQIAELLMLCIIIVLGDYSLYEDVLSGNDTRTILIILITKIISMIVAILLDRLRKERRQKNLVSVAILFPLVVVSIVLIINTKLLLEIKDNKLLITVIFTTSLILFVAVSYAIFFEYYESTKEREKYIEKLVVQNKQQYKLFQEKMLNDQKIRKMYHDMKNHISYLRYCFEKAYIEKGTEYANGLLDQLSTYNVSIHTGNGMLDCLISEMQQKCSMDNIIFKMDINLHEQCFMNDFDVCTLFGNILINAYEATMRLENHENKEIVFKMGVIDSFIVVKISNYILPDKNTKSYLFKTSKSDKENHGLGMKNIDDIVNKYGGIKKISIVGELFILKVIFPAQQLTK